MIESNTLNPYIFSGTLMTIGSKGLKRQWRTAHSKAIAEYSGLKR